MELKFGCEIREPNAGSHHKIIWCESAMGSALSYGLQWGGEVTETALLRDNWKIIGRPIRLADVLLAVRQKFDGKIFMWIDDAGVVYLSDYQYGSGVEEVTGRETEWRESVEMAKYDLRHDSLDHQSEETKQFLIKLLVQL